MRSVFPITLRAKLRDQCRPPDGVFEVNLIEKKLRPLERERWVLDPTPGKENNRLLVWDTGTWGWARPGYLYIIGVDASYGMEGKDAAAIEVMRVGNKWLPDEQVAEFRGTISPLDLAKVAWILGSVYRDRETGLEAEMVVEVNPGSPGIVTQTELLRMGYPNFYAWQKPTRSDGGYTKELGWYTTAATRPLLTEMGVDYIKKEDLIINSQYFLEEMTSFVFVEKQNGHRRMQHAPGYHDDRIIALFMALNVAHGDDVQSMADARRKAEKQRKTPEVRPVQFQQLGLTMDQAMAMWEESLG